MKIFVDDKPLDVLPGMKVKHALINERASGETPFPADVLDEWGNELGLEGELLSGMKIYTTRHAELQKS
jgi:hypothetical protein